ncbi:T9SS type A sorting domain-containing protein [Taibaiella soli]|uniref:Secretion system C-terminal sorting domain-containing protein n=1 Tax=Taibaiella soli TaxID=1649169 RepID=A0A2W2ALK9_9BACT|nr:T9SS type A sorting domain-containing protein [Taibaiella soli]PZF74442.1 hypothetical protein DN068_02355 [Taibaiella soli]
MKRILLMFSLLITAGLAKAQITIQDNIIAAAGDTFRYSTPVDSNLSLATGANMSWDFSTMVMDTQNVQSWKTVAQANSGFILFGVPTNAFGFKLIDSIGFGGITVHDPYTFFLKRTNGSASSLNAVAYGITLMGLPVAANYQDEDEWYIFPMNFGNHDSTTFAFSASVPSVGSLKGKGYRISDVDGWGTIKTPYYPTATSCLRLASTSVETDSITYNGASFAITRSTTDYYWLTQNDQFPALWIETATVSGVTVPMFTRYRDIYRTKPTGINNVTVQKVAVSAYPNPSNGVFHINIPANWREFAIEVYDMSGKLVAAQGGKADIDLSKQAAGQYLVRTSNGADQIGFTTIQKL